MYFNSKFYRPHNISKEYTINSLHLECKKILVLHFREMNFWEGNSLPRLLLVCLYVIAPPLTSNCNGK